MHSSLFLLTLAYGASDLSPDLVEPDDDLHNPAFDQDKIFRGQGRFQMGSRGLLNVGFFVYSSHRPNYLVVSPSKII